MPTVDAVPRRLCVGCGHFFPVARMGDASRCSSCVDQLPLFSMTALLRRPTTVGEVA